MKTFKTKLPWQMNMNDLLKCSAKVRDALTRSGLNPNLEQDWFRSWIPDQSIESNPKRKKQNNKHIFAKIIEVRSIYESVSKLIVPQFIATIIITCPQHHRSVKNFLNIVLGTYIIPKYWCLPTICIANMFSKWRTGHKISITSWSCERPWYQLWIKILNENAKQCNFKGWYYFITQLACEGDWKFFCFQF